MAARSVVDFTWVKTFYIEGFGSKVIALGKPAKRPRAARKRETILKKNLICNPATKALIVLSLCTIVLTGCTPLQKFAARVVDGEVEFMPCDTFQGDQVAVDFRKAGSREYTQIWSIVGPFTLDAGQVIVLGRPLADTETQVPFSSQILENGDLNIGLLAHNPSTGSVDSSMTATFSIEDFKTGEWVDESGKRQDRPCSS